MIARRLAPVFVWLAAASLASPALADPADLVMPSRQGDALVARLHASAPDADPNVLKMAIAARECAVRSGAAPATASRLAIIDYSRPSTQRRLWVFDLDRIQLLFDEYVAHGKGSGENMATAFSNSESSHQSSLGLFETAETYIGDNGYSLRMDGLEPGFNDRARERAIVMHAAAYVNPTQALRQGRMGRSFGCPALRPEVAHAVIDSLKGGQLVFAYYPDAQWLNSSRFLGCPTPARGLAGN